MKYFWPLLVILLVAHLGCEVPDSPFNPSLEQPPVRISDPGTFIIDQSGVIDQSTKEHLETDLKGLYDSKVAQFKVLVVDTTNSEDIFNFTQAHATKWALGEKGKDNGILLVLAVKDRKVRIQTGYGVEPKIPDSYCGSISRQAGKQYFKAGDYSGGVSFMIHDIIKQLGK